MSYPTLKRLGSSHLWEPSLPIHTKFIEAQTVSFLMTGDLLEKYRAFIVAGTPAKDVLLANLNEGETAVYQQLAAQNWRLEQERILQEDVIAILNQLIV